VVLKRTKLEFLKAYLENIQIYRYNLKLLANEGNHDKNVTDKRLTDQMRLSNAIKYLSFVKRHFVQAH